MSATRARATALLACLALVAGGCGLVPGSGGGGIEVTAYFTRAVSLFNGSQVRILGLPAGSVRDVEVEGDRVRVTLRVDSDVPVPADAQATIVPFSLIGERYVQLFPAYTGGPRLEDGAVIPLERTSVPIEPDEALEAVRDFLDTLNPDGTRRLTENLAEDVDGQGETLNDMLREVGQISRDLGSKSDSLGRIIDNFDTFTAALVTREAQLGEVLDDFAVVASVLGDEREHLANIVRNLATFAADARDLVEKHATNLGSDLAVLEHVAKALEANIGAVAQLLDAPGIVATGLRGAYNAENRVVMLRDSGALQNATQGPSALPAGGAGAADTAGSEASGPAGGDGGPGPAPTTPFSPLDDLLREVRERGPLELAGRDSPSARRGTGERVAGAVVDFFGRVGALARDVVGSA